MDTKTLTLEQAVEGYLINARARRLTQNTLQGYTRILRRFVAHFPPDQLFYQITVQQLEEFLIAQTGVSDKTLLNYHVTLSTLYTWATTRHPPLVDRHLMRQIEKPKPEKRIIEPFTKDEVRAMLAAAEYSTPYSRPGKRTSKHKLPQAQRNRTIILLLLDTGLRSSELCNLKISDFDQKTLRLHVFGKGKKERIVQICPRTAETLWAYLTERPDARVGDPLFVTANDTQLNRDRLSHIIAKIGKRAGVAGAHPHRFRHTFAVEFLRNEGDPYTLQAILGHESMDMVRRYVKISQIDIESSHRRASPVDNWRL